MALLLIRYELLGCKRLAVT